MANLRMPNVDWQADTGTNPESAMERVVSADVAPPSVVVYTGNILPQPNSGTLAVDPAQGYPTTG